MPYLQAKESSGIESQAWTGNLRGSTLAWHQASYRISLLPLSVDILGVHAVVGTA